MGPFTLDLRLSHGSMIIYLKAAILKHEKNPDDCFDCFGSFMHAVGLASAHGSLSRQRDPSDDPTGLAYGQIFHGLVVLEATHNGYQSQLSGRHSAGGD
ncbi:hypothetical protein FIBSPDRAFT_225874 [Athelia psychrophila]|uniref:Uncharacterized protein n=1 Tax=Athelia psychrophila TaxID=1759441 RepID=A0A166S834_9AGAM|nr:hypothetical protein FIBSPDRAFT_225874 [Fibularhizoctonia sp. CBS 109695]